jgi:hypothetical protein
MTPYINVIITPVIQISFLVLGNGFSNITSFIIHSIFDPTELGRCSELKFPNITKLYITTLQIKENENIIYDFLQEFLNLIDLLLTFKIWGLSIPNIISKLFWPSLKNLYLDNL